MDIKQLSSRLPKFMNTEAKYAKIIKDINNNEKFFDFMENDFFMNSMKLTSDEMWKVIQDLASQVISQHKMDPIGIQSWIVHLKSVWVDDDDNDEPIKHKKKSYSSSESSSSDSSSFSSSPKNKRRKKRRRSSSPSTNSSNQSADSESDSDTP